MEFSGIIFINVLSYEIYRFTCLQKYLSRKKTVSLSLLNTITSGSGYSSSMGTSFIEKSGSASGSSVGWGKGDSSGVTSGQGSGTG